MLDPLATGPGWSGKYASYPEDVRSTTAVCALPFAVTCVRAARVPVSESLAILEAMLSICMATLLVSESRGSVGKNLNSCFGLRRRHMNDPQFICGVTVGHGPVVALRPARFRLARNQLRYFPLRGLRGYSDEALTDSALQLCAGSCSTSPCFRGFSCHRRFPRR